MSRDKEMGTLRRSRRCSATAVSGTSHITASHSSSRMYCARLCLSSSTPGFQVQNDGQQSAHFHGEACRIACATAAFGHADSTVFKTRYLDKGSGQTKARVVP